MLLLVVTTISATAQRSSGRKVEEQYGKNIIAFSPVSLITDNYVGVGLSYERLVNQYVGIRIPVTTAINTDYFNIGIEAKLYPTRNNGPAKYAIAPMLIYGSGNEKQVKEVYNQVTGYYETITTKVPRTHFGFLLNQTFNFTIMKSFFIGIDGGLGINYYDSRANTYVGSSYRSNDISFAAQLHFALGYRF